MQKILKIPQINKSVGINEFSKVAGYKGSTEKSVTFLYKNHTQYEKEVTKQFHSQ